MNRLFSGNQKRHLYVANGGRCSRCGEQLGESWDAHHVTRFADGGVTELPNGAALCGECHRQLHRSSTVIQPRGWQKAALRKFGAHRRLSFLLEATPGAGKTMFSAFCAKSLFDAGAIDFSLIVVPTTAIKGDSESGFLGDWHRVGIEITHVLKEARGHPREFRGAVITYQQLPNLVSTLEAWHGNGVRLFVVFDEIHHASYSNEDVARDNKWGLAAESTARCAKKVLAMTGTPFRGDGAKISFVDYGDGNVAIPDHRYTYQDAVRDRVCRPVNFMIDDGVAEFLRFEIEHKIKISEAKDEEAGNTARTIFRKDSEWLQSVIAKADEKIDEYRIYDVDAGGLVICRPGIDDNDDKHLHQIADLVREVTGERPEVVTHEDPEANAKIERFRNGTAKWICSVRKISEGVDIKRLRVAVIANLPSTELLFRQLVGRVVRVDNPQKPGDATVFLAKFPQLQQWAARIREEADAGLRDIKRREQEEPQQPQPSSGFLPLGSTHEDGGCISDFGEVFSPAEIAEAIRIKSGQPELADISEVQILRILRKVGHKPSAQDVVTEPLQIQKKKLRDEITRLVRRNAIKLNAVEPDFQGVYVAIFRQFNAKSMDDFMDNHSIEVMRQAVALLRKWLGDANAKAA